MLVLSIWRKENKQTNKQKTNAHATIEYKHTYEARLGTVKTQMDEITGQTARGEERSEWMKR